MGFWPLRGSSGPRPFTTQSGGPNPWATLSGSAFRQAFDGTSSGSKHSTRGLLPFSDAICRFNPVFGQGMSVAAQKAVLLRRLLGGTEGDPLGGLAPAFFAEACGLIQTPWASA